MRGVGSKKTPMVLLQTGKFFESHRLVNVGGGQVIN
jgi:hypothetical protein